MLSLLVILQADVVVETLSALLTHERFLSCVDTHVGSKVFHLVKGPLTHLAFEGLFSRVNKFMPPQSVEVFKALFTYIAEILMRTSVGSDVAVAFVKIVKFLWTVWTAVWLLFLRMSLLMFQFCWSVLEHLQAVFTRMIGLLVEFSAMPFQANLREESFPALWTDNKVDLLFTFMFAQTFGLRICSNKLATFLAQLIE